MKPTLTCLMTVVAIAAVSQPAVAQTSAGRHEVAVKGSFDRGNREFERRATRIDVDGSYGVFVTDWLEFGPAFGVLKVAEDPSRWAISGFVDMHLGSASSQTVPYVRASYGQIFGDPVYFLDPTFATVGPGVKWFFAEGGGALDLGAYYRRQFFDVGGAPNRATGLNEFGLKVGVAIYFGH